MLHPQAAALQAARADLHALQADPSTPVHVLQAAERTIDLCAAGVRPFMTDRDILQNYAALRAAQDRYGQARLS